MQKSVEGTVGRLQVQQHLTHLGIVQLIGSRHATQGLQPAGAQGGSMEVCVGHVRVRSVEVDWKVCMCCGGLKLWRKCAAVEGLEIRALKDMLSLTTD